MKIHRSLFHHKLENKNAPMICANFKYLRQRLFFLLFLFTCSLFAQQNKDSIDTEIINVVSSYKPSLAAAFKMKDVPEIDRKNSTKKKHFYSINSKRILSLFQPDPGAYQIPLKEKKLEACPNYVKIGYGSYNTPLLEAFVTKKRKQHDFSFSLYNSASRGGIPEVLLDNNYTNTKLDFGYKNEQQNHTWIAKVNYQGDRYNWYGLPTDINFENAVIETIEEQQAFRDFKLQGAFLLENRNLKRTDIKFHFFSDKFDSQETQVHLKTRFEFLLAKNRLLTDFGVDILNGSFENNFSGNDALNYGQLTFSAAASYPISINGLHLKLGTQLVHNSDMEKNTEQFYVYPDIQLDCLFNKNALRLYAGVNGGLTQNSYQNFTTTNPYVSPTLNTRPTHEAFNAFLGVQGIIFSKSSYHIKSSLRQENNKFLFQLNPNLSNGTNALAQGYQYGNSFNVVYDDIQTFQLFGELRSELAEHLFVGANLSYQQYTTTLQKSAWNLPSFHSKLFGSYAHEKWLYKAEILLVGNRKDLAVQSDATEIHKDLKGFADVNVSARYQLHPRWNASFEIQNLFNQNYVQFENFNVQGFQLFAGVRYQFHL
jgi:hypothetical protein